METTGPDRRRVLDGPSRTWPGTSLVGISATSHAGAMIFGVRCHCLKRTSWASSIFNDDWVRAARRLSPHVMRDLLAAAGPLLFAYFASLDLAATGGPVSWAGPAPAPVWLDVAREYTERWHHQQHIRDAERTRVDDRHGPACRTTLVCNRTGRGAGAHHNQINIRACGHARAVLQDVAITTRGVLNIGRGATGNMC